MTKPKRTETEALEQAESDAAAEAEAAADAAVDRQALLDNDEAEDGPTSADYSTAFTPRNVAVGLAVVAGLIAFAASRHRRKRDAGREDG